MIRGIKGASMFRKISLLPSPQKAGLRGGRSPLSFDKLRMLSKSSHLPERDNFFL